MRSWFLALSACTLFACSSTSRRPAALDPRTDACASCRMAVSNPKLAAQIVAPGEEPRFFDDIGCLAAYLREHRPEAGSMAFVADHLTGEWILAETASITRVDGIDTPMGSHLIAHRSVQQRDEDVSARGGVAVAAGELFGGTK